jgi:hypothetical protein
VLVTRQGVKLLQNSGPGGSGAITLSRCDLDGAETDPMQARSAFISRFIRVCAEQSSGLPGVDGAPLAAAAEEPLLNRILAVKKMPTWRHSCCNRVEALLAYPLQALMQQALDGQVENVLIQRFVKPKGRRASFIRTRWKNQPGVFCQF